MRLIDPNATKDLMKTMMIYGDTSSGKTSLIGTLARAWHERTGKITRVLMCDEGGIGAIQREVHDGIIQVLELVAEPNLHAMMLWLSQGCWPGECWPEKGKLASKPNLDKVGLVVIDSVTAAAKGLMQALLDKGHNVALTREEEGWNISNASQSNYGDVQKAVLQLLSRFYSLPVDKIIYTALESRGEDKIDKSVILGPMTEGNALTAVLPSRVNQLFHLEVVWEGGVRKHRIYFRHHLDPVLRKPWPATLRMAPALDLKVKAHPVYGKGYIDFETGEEMLQLLDYCRDLVEGKEVVVPAPPTAPAVVKPATASAPTTLLKKA